MKNHYRIHALNYDKFDHDPNNTFPLPNNDIANYNESQPTLARAIMKTELLEWLRSGFDNCNLSSTSSQQASDRITRSMKDSSVGENKDDD
jgi:hypothetical protein